MSSLRLFACPSPSLRTSSPARRVVIGALAALGCLAASGAALAQAYPNKPVRWVSPYGPGSADILSRLLAAKVSPALGQQVLVENRPGGNGMIGTQAIAQSAPDGYSLLLGAAATFAVNPALYAKPGYDPERDFAPIISLAAIPNALIVNPAKVSARTVTELVAAMKAKPGQITYASNGIGTSAHMAAELFEQLAGVKLQHIPYKGSNEAVIAVARGDVDVMFANVPPVLPLLRDGRVRALAVTPARRIPTLDLPTVAESGVPGFDVTTWFALFAPAGTPPAIIAQLNREFSAALADAEVREKLAAQGFQLLGGTPADLAQLVKSDLARWSKVVRDGNIKPE